MISGFIDTRRERERERARRESIEKEDMGPNRARRPILAGLTPREKRPIPQAEQGEGTPLTHPSSSPHPTPLTHSSSLPTQRSEERRVGKECA